jgi:hypothetical protein
VCTLEIGIQRCLTGKKFNSKEYEGEGLKVD